MSNTESIIVGQIKTSSWRKSDTTWTLGLFGTAIGAGVLFFPIRAGFGGLIPILLMLVLAFPIAFYCHRALARLCLSGSNVSGNITETVEEHFGKTGGVVITFLYFFAICPLLWIYGVTITNTFMTFWENQLQLPALNRGVVALFLLLLMAFVIWFGKDLMVKVMSFLVFPFIASLVLISLSLIPYWNSAVIDQVNLSDIAFTGHDGILVTVWLGISIMVFSFNFSPIVSSFVVSKREEYEPEFGKEFTEQKCSKIIGRASLLMVAVVMFFAFSCLFTLSPQNMADAKALLESIARSFGYIYGREKHVRINTVSQSPTPTTAGSGVLGLGDLMEFAENMSPLGNASAEDCADYVLTLFSDLTRKVTMQNLYHDGGFSSMGMSRRAMKTYEKGLRFDDVHQNQYPFGDGEK